MKLDSYDIVILDCDGVVFDSNLLKIDAFRKALNNYSSDVVESFCAYFKNNFGTSRYHLARVFIEEFLGKDFEEELFQQIVKDYGNSCVQLYNEAAFTENFLDFLLFYNDKSFYIASGGDEAELNKVFKAKNIHHYFGKILGSPRKKGDLVNQILMSNPEKKIIMIGDAKSDFLASRENKIDFIYMNQYSLVKEIMEKLSREHGFKIIKNLGELINE